MRPWFNRKFSWRLTFAFCFTTVLSLALTGYLLDRRLRRQFLDELTTNATYQVQTAAYETDPAAFAAPGEYASKLAHELATRSHTRMTFIRADGVVTGDSDVAAADLKNIENHARRKEVERALQGEIGVDSRLSHTVGTPFLYVAAPVKTGGAVKGVIRLALPLDTVKKKLGVVHESILMIIAGMVFVALFLGMWLSRSLSWPIAHMSEVASRLAQGQYNARMGGLPSDEHAELADAMNRLVMELQSKNLELAHEKSQLAAVLSHMTDAVAVVNAKGQVLLVNPALCSLFNVRSEDAKGKVFLEVLRQAELNSLLQAVLRENGIRTQDVRTHSPDERVFETIAIPLSDEGKPAGALLVLHDITKIRRLDNIRRDFVANVSHELRTPLASIKGFAETLRTGAIEDAENRGGFVESIEKQADRMTALVEDLLSLASIESGERKPSKAPVALKELTDDIVRSLAPLAKKKNIRLSAVVEDVSLNVMADREQLRQILVNLIENAIKFNKENGSVTVSAGSNNKEAILQVRDTGMGIPPEDIPRIFERFYRVDKARSREMGGTGLGLSIVKHIIEAHGGAVSVESVLGQGSTFTIRLPL